MLGGADWEDLLVGMFGEKITMQTDNLRNLDVRGEEWWTSIFWPELEDFGKVEITWKKWGWTVDLLVVLGWSGSHSRGLIQCLCGLKSDVGSCRGDSIWVLGCAYACLFCKVMWNPLSIDVWLYDKLCLMTPTPHDTFAFMIFLFTTINNIWNAYIYNSHIIPI